jgi:hypothetical protein
MSNVAKLSLAVVLALVAAAMNAMWLNAEKTPPNFVAAASDIPAGQEITDELLTPVPVPGDPEKLSASLIPFDERAILLGRKAVRPYIRGDMFFQHDIKSPLETTQFDVLGPFRLISVGERFKQANASQQEGQVDPGGNNVTIAVSANFDERTRRLLEIIDPNRKSSREGNVPRITAVQVLPKEEQASAGVMSDKDIVYQTISLDGIENVPAVLLEGEVVRFVVPVIDSL